MDWLGGDKYADGWEERARPTVWGKSVQLIG